MIVQIRSKQRIPVTVHLKNESNIKKRFGTRKFGTFGAKVMPQPMEKYLLLYKREKKNLKLVLDIFKNCYFVLCQNKIVLGFIPQGRETVSVLRFILTWCACSQQSFVLLYLEFCNWTLTSSKLQLQLSTKNKLAAIVSLECNKDWLRIIIIK